LLVLHPLPTFKTGTQPESFLHSAAVNAMKHSTSLNPCARGNGQEQETASLTPEEFFEKNYAKLARYHRHRWNGQGEDVAHQAMKIALEKKYVYMTFALFNRICLCVARDMGVYAPDVSLDELVENGHDFAATQEQGLDERLEILKQDPRFSEAIEKILAGIGITKAVSNYSRFIKDARQAYSQPSLFGGAR
jgi:hypothetical protein